MAAMRLALMRLRCGNFGSSAAAFMGARGLEIRQVIGPATPRVPLLPSLRPAAARNLEGLRQFSTEGMEEVGQNKLLSMKHKAERILHIWWQRSRETLKNDIERRHSILVNTVFAAVTCFMVSVFWSIHLGNRPKPVHSGGLNFLTRSFPRSPSFQPMYIYPPGFWRTYT